VIGFMLRKEGYRTEVFFNGKDLLAQLDEMLPETPDLILLDLTMPLIGGFETTRQLQAGAGKNVPIVIITARKIDASTAEILKAEPNVVDFLSKPIDKDALVKVVRQALGNGPAR
jgi:two-component system response regulator MprA